jgi:hypothetical protein
MPQSQSDCLSLSENFVLSLPLREVVERSTMYCPSKSRQNREQKRRSLHEYYIYKDGIFLIASFFDKPVFESNLILHSFS